MKTLATAGRDIAREEFLDMRSVRISCLALALLGLTACGPGNGLTLARVKGTVTYEGEPVKFGYILFIPDTEKGSDGPIAMSTIKPDGSFDLSTEEPSDGAVVGTHKVRIDGLDPTPVSESEMPNPEQDAKGFLAAKAKSATQRPAASKVVRIYKARDGKSYKILIPQKFESPSTSGISVKVGSGSNNVTIALKADGTVNVSP